MNTSQPIANRSCPNDCVRLGISISDFRSNNRKVLWVLLPLAAAAFVYGIAQLFSLRFSAGDIYPPYSSLRSDPLGAKALYQSLENLQCLTTRRLYEPLYKVESGRDCSLFVLGTAAYALKSVPEKEHRDLDRFLRSGGRVVICLYPTHGEDYTTRRQEAEEKETKDSKEQKDAPGKSKKTSKDKKTDKDEFDIKFVSSLEKWGVKMEYLALDRDEENTIKPVDATHSGEDELPPAISWHSAAYFTDLDSEWRTLYRRGTHPVVIERSFGKGSLALCADSYFASNEALRNEPRAGLIAWLVGSSHQVLFDETHLGVVDNPSIAMLLRKYRLQGLVAGLVALAGLFVWKNATTFVPPEDEESSAGNRAATVPGKDSTSGFANLLRRNIPASEILHLCVAEWKKTRLRQSADSSAKERQIDAVLSNENASPVRERNAAKAYQAIATLLKNERKS